MKLEIKHLAPYLPYKLRYMCLSEINSKEPNTTELKCLDTLINMVDFGHGNAKELDEIKPILKPLSDLRKEEFEFKLFEYGFYPSLADALIEKCYYAIDLRTIHNLYEFLFSNHFDVFDLIPNKLVIGINSLNN